MAITITRPEKDVPLVTDAALRGEWEAVDTELRAARRAASRRPVVDDDRLGDKPTDEDTTVTDLEARKTELEEAMAASVVTFRLRALPRAEWNVLIAKHKPGKDATEEDKRFGAALGPFSDEAVAKSIVAVTGPNGDPVEFDPATEWPVLAAEITSAQWQEFWTAVLGLNRVGVSVPTSRAV